MLKKTLTWGGIALLIFFVAFRPGTVANIVSDLGDAIVALFDIAAD